MNRTCSALLLPVLFAACGQGLEAPGDALPAEERASAQFQAFACDFSLEDDDNDGVCDENDNCVNLPNSDQADLDRDGWGDACDRDDDNDGCTDASDQHPREAKVVVGSYVGVMCTWDRRPILAFEGGDSDADGIRDCQDTDDDNDGIPDGRDPCPRLAAGSPLTCVKLVTCGLQTPELGPGGFDPGGPVEVGPTGP